jgi:type I restriction enzyme S subunit
MMQKIFNRELRFKDDKGKEYPTWKSYKLSEIVDRVTRKNTGLISELPLTISAQYGLVDQLTFFNKTVAGANLEGYYLLEKEEFAYNKSYSTGYPFGAIKRLEKYEKGLLSTLYICFSLKSIVDSDFLTHYFESTKWHNQIVNISGEGARNHGLFNIAVGDFFNTVHYLPDINEQKRIANFLTSLDKMIEISTLKVESWKEQKKGLTKRMFI